MDLKTVIFDLDGTILNTIFDLKEAVNFALVKLGYKERTLKEIREFIGNGLTKLMIRSLGKNEEKEPDEEVLKGVNLFTEYYKEHLDVYTKPFNGIKELLITLKENGFKIGVLSNKDDYAVKLLCDKYYHGLIDSAHGRKEDGIIKPDPILVKNILQELDSNSAYFVGDSDTDALTAISANLKGILVSWGYEDLNVLEKYDVYYNSGKKEILFLHLKRAIDLVIARGLNPFPKIGIGDWNDGFSNLGSKGKGESVWLGFFLYDNLNKFIKIYEKIKDICTANLIAIIKKTE
mgnify:CR=1 FL=1